MNEWVLNEWMNHLYLTGTTAPSIVIKGIFQQIHILMKWLRLSEKWCVLKLESLDFFLSPTCSPLALPPQNSQDLTLRNTIHNIEMSCSYICFCDLSWLVTSHNGREIGCAPSPCQNDLIHAQHILTLWKVIKNHFYSLLVLLQQSSSFMSKQPCSHAVRKLYVVINLIGVTGRKSKIQSSCLWE